MGRQVPAIVVGPPLVWAPPILFGVLLGLLAAIGVFSVGPCLGGMLLTWGIVLLIGGTGVGLATHPYGVAIAVGIGGLLIVLGLVLPHVAGSC